MATNFEKYYNKQFQPLEIAIKKETEKLNELYRVVLSATNKSNLYWKNIEAEMTKIYRRINKLYSRWNKIEIPKLYRKEMLLMNHKIQTTKRITATAQMNVTTLINSNSSLNLLTTIVNDSLASFNSAILQGQNNFRRFARLTQQQLVNEAVFESTLIKGIAEGDIRRAVSEQYKILKSKLGDSKFVQAGSKTFKPYYYAELVTRTKFHETQSNGALFTALNYGTDLIRVSSHNTTTKICQEFEGKLYSISGRTKQFPQLFETSPFHPNCLHLMFPEFVEGYSNKQLLELSEFSKGLIDKPPFPAGFVPVNLRGVA